MTIRIIEVVNSTKQMCVSLWKTLAVNRIIRIATYASCMLCAVTIILPLVVWAKLPPLVPLWFSKPWGLERLAPPGWLFLLPISGLFFLAINMCISLYLLTEHLVFSQILFIASFIVAMLSCITVLEIIFLVI